MTSKSDAETPIQAEVVIPPSAVEVTAPATLAAGYTFNASYEGTVFPVTVPSGGVTEGQKLRVPFQAAGTRKWKDDIFACTRHGCCHPSLLNACCCSFLLMGQIMTRLKLNYLANPAPADETSNLVSPAGETSNLVSPRPAGKTSNTYMILVCITAAYAVVQILFPPTDPTDPEQTPSPIGSLLNFGFMLFMLLIVTKVRKLVRQQQGIPESNCVGCEDCCCAFWCGCCTVSQLARQTTNYDIEEARFFSSNGLAPEKQVVVVV